MEASERLKEVISGLKDLPTLPSVAVKVKQLISSPRTGAGDLAPVIENDQAITLRLLSVVNSAFYGLPRRITNVKEGIAFLGTNAISQIVFGLGVISTFSGKSPDGFKREEFWRHSIAVAAIARRIAKGAGYTAAEDAFTAGLLHDLGKIVLSTASPSAMKAVLEAVKAGKPYQAAEREALGVGHGNIGEWVGKNWELPLIHIVAIRYHHDAPADRTGLSQGTDRIVDIVAAADWAARQGKIGWSGADESAEPPAECFERAGMAREAALELMEKSRPDIASAVNAMGL
jgi:HD-like signal output (HDOD) protein